MRKLTQEQFIEKCYDKHHNRYDYSKTKYVNNKTKIIVTCPNHGDFEILPYNHSDGEQGCKLCAQENHKLSRISPERLSNMMLVHDNKYAYNDLCVTDGNINITCPIHGIFTQSIYHHEYGCGCYKCGRDSMRVVKYKICLGCKENKELSFFNKNKKTCKSCIEKKPNIESKICVGCKAVKKIGDFYKRKDSPDGYRKNCIFCEKIIYRESKNTYKQKNKEVLRKKDIEYRKNRMVVDPFYRAKIDARNVIRKAISKRGYSKNSKTEQILGCSFIDFKEHIESQFLLGMNWDNRDQWHIDHIIPVSFAKNGEELLKLNHYSNLRPLWVDDNQKKSDEIEIETDIYHEILEMRNH